MLKRMGDVYVFGDVMVDEYRFLKPTRLSPEGPVPVCQFVREEKRIGGAGNVAANIRAILDGVPNTDHSNIRVNLYGVVGENEQIEVGELAARHQVHAYLYPSSEALTIRKKRYLTEDGHILFREDQETTHAVEASEAACGDLYHRLRHDDLLVISDYGKGTVPSALFNNILVTPCPVLVNCKPDRIALYGPVSVLVLNESEARSYLNDVVADCCELPKRVQRRIEDSTKAAYHIVVTCGERGLYWLDTTLNRCAHIEAEPVGVVDVTGAGDTIIAAIAAQWRIGHKISCDTLHVATHLAASVVAKVGTAVPSPLRQRREALITA